MGLPLPHPMAGGFVNVPITAMSIERISHMAADYSCLAILVARNIPVVPIKETGVKVPDATLGNRQYIPLDQADRLACMEGNESPFREWACHEGNSMISNILQGARVEEEAARKTAK
jgi:hypothetical protein